MPEAVIVSTARSAIGRANKGSLTKVRPDDLAATIVRAALDKVPALDASTIDDVMLGCASLEGTDPSRLALPLAFLHHHATAAGEWSVKAVPERYVSMNRIGKEGIDAKAALHGLPPLIKGYLRLGACFGDGAVVDHQFGTTDVLVILPVEKISERYVGHFGPGAERHAA